jgi:acyl-CoA hydrolase
MRRKMEKKRISDSRTEQVHILMPADTNGSGRLFGGVLMQWIDTVAAVVARRHSNADVTTASVDSLRFLAPVVQNETVLLAGHISYAGNTSMEICVDTFVEALDGGRRIVNNAHVLMVAVDEKGAPRRVPGLLLETERERAEWAEACKRHERRKKERG